MAPFTFVPQFNGPSPASRRTWTYEVIGLALVSVVVIFVAVYPRNRPTPQTSTSSLSGNTLAVPDSFSDFSGQVVTVQSDQLKIRAASFDREGKLNVKFFTVSVNSETQFEQSAAKDQVADPKPIAMSDLKPNDQVVVFSSENLAAVTNFTATKLIRYQP